VGPNYIYFKKLVGAILTLISKKNEYPFWATLKNPCWPKDD
jgi:hypothetical protein